MITLLFEIMAIVMPVFLVIGLGYAVKRSALVDGSFLFQLNRLVYYLALPLLLFYKIAEADFGQSFNAWQVIGLAAVIFAGFAVTYVFAAVQNYSPEVRGTFSQCAFRGNLAYIGLAIVFNAYGEEGLASAGILLGFIVPVLNFFAIIALLLPQRETRMSFFPLVRQVLVNPLIIASFLGIFWSYFNVPLPVVIDRALHIVTGMALPLALISIGASFSVQKLRGDLKIASLAAFFKLVITPLGAALVFMALGVHGRDLAVGVLFAGTPTATVAYIFSQQMKGDAELAGAIIMLTTVASVFTYTLSLLILKSAGV